MSDRPVQRFTNRIRVPVLNFRFTEPKIPFLWQNVLLQIRCALDFVTCFLHIFPSSDFTHSTFSSVLSLHFSANILLSSASVALFSESLFSSRAIRKALRSAISAPRDRNSSPPLSLPPTPGLARTRPRMHTSSPCSAVEQCVVIF
jgi:hypothetical protein